MTRYMEEMVMTEYLVVRITPSLSVMQVETMLFMEEMVMTSYMLPAIQRYMEKVAMTP